ncbi:MAG: hypothetical protein ACOZQL_03990 [Myxococcota bacterium]
MARTLLVGWLLWLSGCAENTSELTGRSSGEFCWWRGTRWEDGAPLLVRGAGVPLGRARARWDGEEWAGARTAGALRRHGERVLYEGTWTGGGFVLEAEVDATRNALFHAWGPTRIVGGLVHRGAPLQLVDARLGGVLVAPSEAALALFTPRASPIFELGCEGLSLLNPPEDDGPRLLARAGFKPLREVRLRSAITTPEGQWTRAATEVPAFVVEQAQEVSRVAVPVKGVLWVDWLDDTQLAPAPEPADGEAPRQLAPARAPTGVLRQCDEEVPLFVELGDARRKVGHLQSRARFIVRGRRSEGMLSVVPAVPWLELAADVELLAAASAVARCDEAGAQ